MKLKRFPSYPEGSVYTDKGYNVKEVQPTNERWKMNGTEPGYVVASPTIPQRMNLVPLC